MAAAEYDVLVHLKVSRESQKAMGVAAGTFRATMRKAETDQKAMARADIARTRLAEREKMRALGVEQRARRRHEQNEQRAAKQAERQRRRAIGEEVRAQKQLAAEVSKRRAAMASAGGATARGAGGLFGGVGTGDAAAWASKAGLVITGVLAGAVAAGLGKAMTDGFQDNVKKEQQTGGIGTTLQLYDFNAYNREGRKNDEGEQFAENLENAKWYQQELQRIADSSPGDLEDVSTLFQGALPGMASVTQDANRITDLTQKLSLLSAVLDGDFKTVGAQSSRILTGGAGAEFETWNRLQKPIRQAGIEMGVFAKNQSLGTKLTEKFNKLNPEERLTLFEKGLERLGKPIADYYENTYEGITSQAKSTFKTLRMEFAKGSFDSIKSSLKGMNQGQGVLGRGSKANENAREFAGFLGKQVGDALGHAMNFADNAATYIANNWREIVVKAQDASHYLVQGAKAAAAVMGTRMGVGLAGGAMSMGLGGVTGIASAAGSIAQLGGAALVAVPALIAMGIVTGGLGLLFGGAVTYIVSNLDDLSSRFISWTQSAGEVIDPLFMAIDTIGAKFEAMGAYLLGASEGTDIFTTITTGATTVVETLTSVFSELIGMTASVIETFAGAADFLTGVFNPSKAGQAAELALLYGERSGMSDMASEEYGNISDRIASLEDSTRTYSERAAGVVSTIRGAKDVFDNTKGTGSQSSLSWMAYEKIYPMGPAPPPNSFTSKTPPKVKVNQTNKIYMNLKDADPNAIVAAHNKETSRRAAMGIKSAMSLTRRA